MQFIRILTVAVVCLMAAAQSPDRRLKDSRLSVHTLLREDIFAGVQDQDMDRFAKGEQNIELLLKQRPEEKPALLAWKAGAILYRGVLALEAKRSKEFEEKHRQAVDLFSQAKQLVHNDVGVAATTAGMYVLLADRLPESLRGAAWATAYECYQELWKSQGSSVKKLPLHMRGELLGGLAESAQRTGRTKEMAEYVDRILAVAPDTAYARAAQRWKENPQAAQGTRITCHSCHSPGRLAAREATLGIVGDNSDDAAGIQKKKSGKN